MHKMHTHKYNKVKTQSGDSHPQAKKRGLRRNQTCQYLALGHTGSKTMKIHISVIKSPTLLYHVTKPLGNEYAT